jgi:RimJ/RimL family protein N-acetyltransferase
MISPMELVGEHVTLRPLAADDVETKVEGVGDAVGLAVLERGVVVGLVQYYEEDGPELRHAGIDVGLDPRVHGRGLGTDVVGTLARYLVDVRRHHRLVIDPDVDDARAIRCYQKVGFRLVGVMRVTPAAQTARGTTRCSWIARGAYAVLTASSSTISASTRVSASTASSRSCARRAAAAATSRAPSAPSSAA